MEKQCFHILLAKCKVHSGFGLDKSRENLFSGIVSFLTANWTKGYQVGVWTGTGYMS